MSYTVLILVLVLVYCVYYEDWIQYNGHHVLLPFFCLDNLKESVKVVQAENKNRESRLVLGDSTARFEHSTIMECVDLVFG